jgi:hypothetical protein
MVDCPHSEQYTTDTWNKTVHFSAALYQLAEGRTRVGLGCKEGGKFNYENKMEHNEIRLGRRPGIIFLGRVRFSAAWAGSG